MTPTEFALFKYQHADRADLSPARLRFIYVSLAVAVVVGLVTFGVGAVLLLVPGLAYLMAGKHLKLGPRYLLCGKSIVYYANVKRVVKSSTKGSLQVQSANGQSFVLERDKFPTGARKADKIAKNKAAKFEKVSNKIIEKVRKANGDADVSGA
jgi:hypothetical protein